MVAPGEGKCDLSQDPRPDLKSLSNCGAVDAVSETHGADAV